MANKDNEISGLQQLLYAFMIGLIYYYGAVGWSSVFTNDDAQKNKAGIRNLYLLVLEIVFFFAMLLTDALGSKETFGTPFIAHFFYGALVHFLVSFIGLFVALIVLLFRYLIK